MPLAPGSFSFPAQYSGYTLFVDGSVGSDGTGQRGRADLPFQTITAANKASQVGDLIFIRFGIGTYSDTVANACMALRFYQCDPGIIFSDPTLNGELVRYWDLEEGATSATATHVSSAANPFSPDHVGRELVILSELGGTTNFTYGRYLIKAVDSSGNATLNAIFTTSNPGSLGGIGYLSPGPMQTQAFTSVAWPNSAPGPMINGQTDGLLQYQRFLDAQFLETTGGGPPSNGNPIIQANPELLQDGATPYANQPAPNVSASNHPTWSSSGYIETVSGTALTRSLSTTAPNGACTIIASSLPGTPLSDAPICGQADSTNPTRLLWSHLSAGTAILDYGSSKSISVAGSSATWNVIAARQVAYTGGTIGLDSTELYIFNSTVNALTTDQYGNTSAFSSQDNYLAGWSSGVQPNIEIAHYAFFDGATSLAKMHAWKNAFLQDLGEYPAP